MVSTMADIKGVDIWVNFTETDRGVLCELRSSRFNINPIAVKYGGGGHAKASGATVKDLAEAMAMLADLDAMMEAAE
jgi:phosphoesterase RecJ-like protein